MKMASMTASIRAVAPPAVPSAGQSHMDFSDKLSQKVLASLRALNDSLTEVRTSVAKIDSIATQRLNLSFATVAGRDGGGAGDAAVPPLPLSGSQPLGLSFLQATRQILGSVDVKDGGRGTSDGGDLSLSALRTPAKAAAPSSGALATPALPTVDSAASIDGGVQAGAAAAAARGAAADATHAAAPSPSPADARRPAAAAATAVPGTSGSAVAAALLRALRDRGVSVPESVLAEVAVEVTAAVPALATRAAAAAAGGESGSAGLQQRPVPTLLGGAAHAAARSAAADTDADGAGSLGPSSASSSSSSSASASPPSGLEASGHGRHGISPHSARTHTPPPAEFLQHPEAHRRSSSHASSATAPATGGAGAHLSPQHKHVSFAAPGGSASAPRSGAGSSSGGSQADAPHASGAAAAAHAMAVAAALNTAYESDSSSPPSPRALSPSSRSTASSLDRDDDAGAGGASTGQRLQVGRKRGGAAFPPVHSPRAGRQPQGLPAAESEGEEDLALGRRAAHAGDDDDAATFDSDDDVTTGEGEGEGPRQAPAAVAGDVGSSSADANASRGSGLSPAAGAAGSRASGGSSAAHVGRESSGDALDADLKAVEAKLRQQQPAAPPGSGTPGRGTSGRASVTASAPPSAATPTRAAASAGGVGALAPVPASADGILEKRLGAGPAAAATADAAAAATAAAAAASGGGSAPVTSVPAVRYTFPRYEEPPETRYEDDGSLDDIPYTGVEVPAAAFLAAEEEAAELKRVKGHLQALKAAREAEKRAEAAAAAGNAGEPIPSRGAPGAGSGGREAEGADTSSGDAAEASGSGAGGDAAADPDFTIWDATPPPQVLRWVGGDAEWRVADGAGSSAAQDALSGSAAHKPGTGSGGRLPPRFEAFNLRVVYEAGKTGFEEAKEFSPPLGSVIAGRYRVRDYLGSAAFSTALACTDLCAAGGEDDAGGASGASSADHAAAPGGSAAPAGGGRHEPEPSEVCLKVIKNVKDFVDQSLDEIKLLRYINALVSGTDREGEM